MSMEPLKGLNIVGIDTMRQIEQREFQQCSKHTIRSFYIS